jgi:hypothetical protein
MTENESEGALEPTISEESPAARPHPLGPSNAQWLGDNTVPAALRSEWFERGFVKLEGVFTTGEIEAYNAVVAETRGLLDDGKDEHGMGDRIGQLHQMKPELLELPSNERVRNFLEWIFGEEPVLMGSLQFERGTEQVAHIDAIFFWPEPAYAMAGVWIALEDVDPEAGPLFYLSGSHKWPFFHSDDVVRSRPELAERRRRARQGEADPDLIGQIANAWIEDFKRVEAEFGAERICPPLKAGDAVVWHSLLAHGGSPKINPALSRRSAVYHFLGTSAGLYTFEQFMLYGRDELALQPPQETGRGHYKGLNYMKFPYVVSYSGGKEVVTPI